MSDDKKTPIYDTISRNIYYKNMHPLNPLKPLVIWANTNSMLDEYYKRPEVNLLNSEKDNTIRNDMRHFTGLALTQQEYPTKIARKIGNIKEYGDLLHNFYFEKPHFGFPPNYHIDALIDRENNELGMQYARNNPNATPLEIMDYAYNNIALPKTLYQKLVE